MYQTTRMIGSSKHTLTAEFRALAARGAGSSAMYAGEHDQGDAVADAPGS